ncbi:MAG: hypothetical protein MK135_04965 [Polyangiaceae bacterium]|nr:hypothetical protein [Polyangiaceae bacterium]
MSDSSYSRPEMPIESLQLLLELFQEHEEALVFPQISSATLQKSQQLIEEQRQRVEEAAAALEAAQAELVVSETEFLTLAQQAHAYASIYAASDKEMQKLLTKIKLEEPQKGSKKKRTLKRKPRSQEASHSAEGLAAKEKPAEEEPAEEELRAEKELAFPETAETEAGRDESSTEELVSEPAPSSKVTPESRLSLEEAQQSLVS